MVIKSPVTVLQPEPSATPRIPFPKEVHWLSDIYLKTGHDGAANPESG